MTNTTLRRTATLAAAFCAALALSTPAHALDVQIQEGAAVKFPKGLKWEPMVKTVVEAPPKANIFTGDKETLEEQKKRLIASGTAEPKVRERAIAFWNAQSMDATIASWETRTNDGSYFITAANIYGNTNKCDTIGVDFDGGGAMIPICKTKVTFQPLQGTHSSNVDVGNICMHMGFVEQDDDEPDPDFYSSNHPEIAFDTKSRTFYLRQIIHGKVAPQCNRKITLTPGDKTSGGAAQNAATPAPASQSQSGTAIAGDMTPRRALEALYGKLTSGKPLDGDCKEYASWKPPLNTEKFKDYFQFGEQYKNQPLLVCSKFSASYTEQDKQKFVLVTKAGVKESFDTINFGTSEVPAPILGMAIFVKDGDQWRLEVEDRFVTHTSFSENIKLQKIGANKYGVLSTTAIHSGAGCNLVTVEVLMPYAGGITAQELNVPLTEKEDEMYNGGDCSATSVKFDTKANSEYYPVTVTQTFTDDRGRHPKKSARLTFSNGSYVKSK